jgi:hypothetical protein
MRSSVSRRVFQIIGGIGGLQQPPDGPSLPAMSALTTWKTLTSAAVLLASAVCGAAQKAADDFNAVDGPNVRVMRHEDGARTLFTRTPDNRTLTKKKFSANGVLMMLTVYRMDSNGNPIGCRISDGQGNLLFKVSYGYRKSDGQLVEERMFDARVVRKDPNTGKEMPIQRICYVYDAQGNRSAPIIYNLLPGKTFEEVFGMKSSALETNPFNEKGGLANPNARPTGR